MLGIMISCGSFVEEEEEEEGKEKERKSQVMVGRVLLSIKRPFSSTLNKNSCLFHVLLFIFGS